MHLEAVVHAHAAAFLAHTPWDVAHDETLLADAHATAWRCYSHRCVTVSMDPAALELEAWGADIHPDESGAQFICHTPLLRNLDDIERLTELTPDRHRILACTLAAARQVGRQTKAKVAIPVCGPVSLLRNLLGAAATRRLLVRDESAFGEAARHLISLQMPWLRAVASSGVHLSIVGDTIDPELHEPARFARVVLPLLATMAAEIHHHTREHPPILVEGNTTSIVAQLAEAGAGMVICGWGTGPVAFLNELRAYPEVTVRFDVARGMWVDGDWHEICRRLADATKLARFHPNLLLGTGTLPINARSVLLVDAFSFAENLDPWMSAV